MHGRSKKKRPISEPLQRALQASVGGHSPKKPRLDSTIRNGCADPIVKHESVPSCSTNVHSPTVTLLAPCTTKALDFSVVKPSPAERGSKQPMVAAERSPSKDASNHRTPSNVPVSNGLKPRSSLMLPFCGPTPLPVHSGTLPLLAGLPGMPAFPGFSPYAHSLSGLSSLALTALTFPWFPQPVALSTSHSLAATVEQPGTSASPLVSVDVDSESPEPTASISHLDVSASDDLALNVRFRTSRRRAVNKGMTVERRIEANARERNRVHTIGAAFERLRKMIPSLAPDQKLSKLSILRITCKYIMMLASMSGKDYSNDQQGYSVTDCVDLLSQTIVQESKARKN